MAGIVNLDKLQAVYVGNIESVVNKNGDLENGMVIALGALDTGEREVRLAVAPDPTEVETQEILLHASPELDYDSLKNGLKNFKVLKGKVGRAYHLTVGDIFTVSDDMIVGDTKVGEYVVPGSTMKLVASATMTVKDAEEKDILPRFVGLVIEKGTIGFDGADATTIQVIRA